MGAESLPTLWLFWPPSGFAWTGVEWSVESFFTLFLLLPWNRSPGHRVLLASAAAI